LSVASTTCSAVWNSRRGEASITLAVPLAAANSVIVKPGQTAVTFRPADPYSASSAWLKVIIRLLAPG
jgi:hypothetical protein